MAQAEAAAKGMGMHVERKNTYANGSEITTPLPTQSQGLYTAGPAMSAGDLVGVGSASPLGRALMRQGE